MLMYFQGRQKSSRLNFARVALLSVSALLSLGFSNAKRVGSQIQIEPRLGAATLTPPVATQPQPVPLVASLKLPAPSRPSSFAKDASLGTVLGEVDSLHWVSAAIYAPDRGQDEDELRQLQPTTFRGVGFPDIQTHLKQVVYFDPTADLPNRWNQMVSWRDNVDGKRSAEPIAHVRCMGLSPQAVARRAEKFDSLILALAIEYRVSASLIKAVVTEESCFNTKAVSPVGAQGLMQLMPNTANWLKVNDPNNPEDNLRAGVRYLAYLKGKFNSRDLVLAAYNAGPGNVRRYSGVPPFAETEAYIKKVKSNYRRYAAATRLSIR